VIEAGERFPTFDLEAHDGQRVTSASLLGRPYLLFFYPKADTPGCTRQACGLRDHWRELEAAGLTVFGVSYDKPAANRAFAERRRLPFRLLSDRGGRLARLVDARRAFLPVPKRVSYMVGPDGIVLEAYPAVSPVGHAEEVLRDWQRLRVSSDG
jgi:thioredoxin-dependent peroxiredoxin